MNCPICNKELMSPYQDKSYGFCPELEVFSKDFIFNHYTSFDKDDVIYSFKPFQVVIDNKRSIVYMATNYIYDTIEWKEIMTISGNIFDQINLNELKIKLNKLTIFT